MSEDIQELITRITIETADALSRLADFNAAVEIAKTKLKELAQQGNMSVQEAAKGIGLGLEAQLKQLDAQISQMKELMRSSFANIRSMTSAQLATVLNIPGELTPGAETNAAKKALMEEERKWRQEQIEFAKREQEQIKQSAAIYTEAQKQMGATARAEAKQTEAETKQAKQAEIAAQKEYEQITRQGYGVMSAAAKTYSMQVMEVKTQIVQMSQQQGITYQQAAEKLVASGTSATTANQALRELNTTASQSKSTFSGLSTVLNAVSISLGLTLFAALNTIKRVITEIIKSAQEFAQAMAQLEISTRALQRAGLDVSLKEMSEQIDELSKKWKIFSRKEIVEGVGFIQLLTRNLNLSTEQMKNLFDMSGALAVLMGKDMNEAARELALFLSSGYGEALQKAGILASRSAVMHEALRMGMKGGYQTLTEQQRAQAGYNVLMQQSNTIMQDAIDLQDKQVSQAKRTTTAWKNLGNQLGAFFYPVIQGLSKGVEALGAILQEILAMFILTFSKVFNVIVATFDTIQEMIDTGNWLDFKSVFEKKLKEVEDLNVGQAMLDAVQKGEVFSVFGDAVTEEMRKAKEGVVEMSGEIIQATMDLYTQMLDLQNEFAEKSADIEQKYQDKLKEIDEKARKERVKIMKSWQDEARKNFNDAERDINNAKNKYALDVLQTNRQFNQRRAESEAKYREQQIKEEISYQERLKKLREGFLMDLEDALRERDALATLRAIRQYNLQKKQADREHNISMEELKRAHKLELQELEAQRAERLRILKEELDARIAMIREELRIRQEEAWRERQAALAALPVKTKEEKDALAAERAQDLLDLDKWYADQTATIIARLQEQYSLTDPQLKAISKLYQDTFGPDGAIPKAIDTTMKRLAALSKAMAGLSFKNSGAPTGGKKVRASGGIDYANKATSLTFGEAGPEMALTVPLTRPFSGNQYLNGNSVSSLSDKKGSIDIALLLSPDLEAKIVRQSGEHVANVLMEVQRNT